MIEWIMGHLEIVIGAAAAIIFIVGAVLAIKKSKKLDTEGVEADAVVSKVNKTYDGETRKNQYTFYLTYTDENGTEREARLMTNSEDYQKGQTLRIKYLPGKYKTAKPI